jgi:hypothetical protein
VRPWGEAESNSRANKSFAAATSKRVARNARMVGASTSQLNVSTFIGVCWVVCDFQ